MDLTYCSGPARVVITAIRASQLGLKTAVVEKENLEAFVLTGCIPTKALLKSAQVLNTWHAEDFGIKVSEYGLTL